MDQSAVLVGAVAACIEQQRPLHVAGMGSKRHLVPAMTCEALSTVEHTGVIDYQPSELVVRARSGTPLKELQLELAREQQCLMGNPPLFSGRGTVGGAVSAGLSGPDRVSLGSISDGVLGVTLLNGKAETLSFGGQVMKNVAGYDVSRLVCGAFGSLGLLLDVSLRTQPILDHDLTLVFDWDADTALEHCRSMARQPLPVTATFWHNHKLFVRLQGNDAAVRSAQQRLGGDTFNDDRLWLQIRDQQHDFFSISQHLGQSLVRVISPPGAPLPAENISSGESAWALQWQGGLRWFWSEQPDQVHAYAQAVGGWAWTYGQAQPLPAAQARIMQRIKAAFDPQAVFNSPLAFRVEGGDAD